MCATAARLVDRVLPDMPLRQWVLSIPFELRLLLAKNPAALSAAGRLFVRSVSRFQREQARLVGIRGARSAAVSFPQRFVGSLNLNVHFHVAVPDGVFTLGKADERASFHLLAAPTAIDLADIALEVSIRLEGWLRRRGLLRDDEGEPSEAGAEDRPGSALDACLEASLGLGALTRLAGGGGAERHGDDRPPPKSAGRRGAQHRGFDVHAGVVVSAADRVGRERLLRYCARPALSLERLSVLRDGRVAYALRTPWGRQTHRVMTPVEFLARLSALVPPPRRPLIRFHGVLAPHAAWRKKVVPLLAPDSPPPCSAGASADSITPGSRSRAEQEGIAERRCAEAANQHDEPTGCGHRELASRIAITAASRIDWAELLKRVYDVDALACSCGGRLRFIALILDAEVARRILDRLNLPSAPPPLARARSPDFADLPLAE